MAEPTVHQVSIDPEDGQPWTMEVFATWAATPGEPVIQLPQAARAGDIAIFHDPKGRTIGWARVAKRRKLSGAKPGMRYVELKDVSVRVQPADVGADEPRPTVCRVIDFGVSPVFAQAALASAETLRALHNTSLGYTPADRLLVETIGTASPAVVGDAISDQHTRLVHVMSHGLAVRQGSLLGSDSGTEFNSSQLAKHLRQARRGRGAYLGCDILLLDACQSAFGDFRAAVTSMLDRPLLFIGATKEVEFPEATTYTHSLYAALAYLQVLTVERFSIERAMDAHKRADEAFYRLRGEPAPFAAQILSATGELVL